MPAIPPRAALSPTVPATFSGAAAAVQHPKCPNPSAIDTQSNHLTLFVSHFELWGNFIMSMHRSLKGSTKIYARRNVMKRYERIEILRKTGRWKEGDKVIGLPKTKNE